MGTSFSSPFIVIKVFQWALKNTPAWLPRLNWARLSTRAVYCSEDEEFLCETRLPVASHQPPNSLAILLSLTLFRTHPSSSERNHPSENTTEIHLCASAEPGGNDLVFTGVWLWKPASLPGNFFVFFLSQNFKIFLSPYVSEHKMKMRSPLSGGNFPWVKPIEHYSAVSNLSGKVFERYSRMLDAHV